MTTDASQRAFYCPVHQVRFYANGDAAIQCEHSSHSIGYGFPQDSTWTYCCDCATFWPSESVNHGPHTECLVCERTIAKRYLCHSCRVISVESSALIRKRAYSIDGVGVRPGCPGCGSAAAGKSLEHNCAELGISFLTARAECLFCELELVTSTAASQTSKVCASCAAELVAPYRFCKRCGKAQPESDPAIPSSNTDGLLIEDPTLSFDVESGEDPDNTESGSSESSPWDYSIYETPPKRRTPWIIGGAAVVLSVSILLVVVLLNSNRSNRPVRTSNTPAPVVPEAQTSTPPGMVYIAGGEFVMGNDSGDEYERPAHKVQLAPFYVDVNEVTCEAYRSFIAATGHQPPRNWTNGMYPSGSTRRPVTGVDWRDAKAYADWANKRLPTEEEWEFVARGGLGAAYPWGNEWQLNYANAGNSAAPGLLDVGSFPRGKTRAGVMDIIGNAWEWTASDVVVYPGGRFSSPLPRDVKIIRGGSWQESEKQATTTYRGFLRATGAEDYSATGFRCVKDIPAPNASNTQQVSSR